jgi:hypothetical protein
MGSYGELRVGTIAIESWKNEIEPTIMTLFVEGDKHVDPILLETWTSEGGDEEDWSSDRSSVEYTCTVGDMKDRLDVRGFTVAVAEQAFKIGVKGRIRELTDALERSANLESQNVIESAAPDYVAKTSLERRTLDVLRTISPSSWLDAFRRASEDSRCGRHIRFEEVNDLDRRRNTYCFGPLPSMDSPPPIFAVCSASLLKRSTQTKRSHTISLISSLAGASGPKRR